MEGSPKLEGLYAEDSVASCARERFGLAYLYPVQRLVIANILEAASGPGAEPDPAAEPGSAENTEDADRPPPRQVVILPTGAGKSLCFQLPALLLEGPSIIVYPLLALMEDQRKKLEALGLPHAILRGGQSPEERAGILARLAAGKTKILITNPETLSSPGLLSALARLKPAHIAIDEAHCVSEWGESFRPAYLRLGGLLEALQPRAVSAFTATASPLVLEAFASSLFGGQSYRLLSGDPDRPNISFEVRPCLSRNHCLEALIPRLEKPLIVFLSSRKGAEFLAALLGERFPGQDLRFYHAGLEREEKLAVEAWFLASDTGILAATCAYGLGVDKKNVRSVIHYELPPSVEAYLQEAGRAGRDGLPSTAVLLAGPDEEGRSAREGDPGRMARRAALLGYARSTAGCRREALLGLLGAAAQVPCSGCDRCEGRAPEDFEGAAELRAFLEAQPRRYTPEQALDRLRGRPGEEPPLVAGSGSCADWRAEDLREALAAYLRLGRARRRPRSPWKGRLELRPATPPRSPHSKPPRGAAPSWPFFGRASGPSSVPAPSEPGGR